MKKVLIILFVCYSISGWCQNRLIVSKVKTDSSTITTYITERGDYNGFEKINDSTYQLIDIDKPCESGNPVMLDGVQTFESLPCFRDYLLKKVASENKIVVWGKLEVEEQKNIINAWEVDRLSYVGSWSIPNENSGGCKCAFSKIKGSYLELKFQGTGIRLISEKVNTHGLGNIYLDGKLVKSEDFYSVSSINPYVPFEVFNLENTNHTIRFEVGGDKYIVLHRFEVFNKPIIEEPVECMPDTVVFEVIKHDTIFIEKPVYIDKIKYDTVYVDRVRYDTLQPKIYIKADEFEFEIK